MHWNSWSNLCGPKSKSGMGFRDLEDFNSVLLARQGWHILKQPESLVARVLKGKYFPSSSFLNAKMGSRTS